MDFLITVTFLFHPYLCMWLNACSSSVYTEAKMTTKT